MLTVSSIAHVAIRVKDVARILDFYVGKLGMREMMRLDRDGRLWLLCLRITDNQFLEVFPEGVGERAAEREAVGFNHLCLKWPISTLPCGSWKRLEFRWPAASRWGPTATGRPGSRIPRVTASN